MILTISLNVSKAYTTYFLRFTGIWLSNVSCKTDCYFQGELAFCLEKMWHAWFLIIYETPHFKETTTWFFKFFIVCDFSSDHSCENTKIVWIHKNKSIQEHKLFFLVS